MSKKFYLVSACFIACMVFGFVFYGVTESIYAAVAIGVIICAFLLFVIITTFIDAVRKKKRIAAALVIVNTAVVAVFISLIVHGFILMEQKQDEIDAITARIEAEEDADERWRLNTDVKWQLIDERFELSQRTRLYTIGFGVALLLMPRIKFDEKQSEYGKSTKDKKQNPIEGTNNETESM